MQLYFLRHAQAVDKIHHVDSPARPLTPKGQQQAQHMGRFARQLGLQFDALYSSPYTRALQTGAHFRAQLRQAPALQTLPWLAIHTPVAQALQGLRQLSATHAQQRLLLIGHEPDFSILIGALLRMPAAHLKIRKGSLTLLQSTQDEAAQGWQLRWSLPPDTLPQKRL